VHNVRVIGSGTIDGNGAILQGAPPNASVGQGTKAIGLVDSTHVTVDGVTLLRGGWFTILATNCEHLTITRVTIRAARDAMDIMGCRHVYMSQLNISGGGDDAVKFGAEWSRGKRLSSYNVTVANSVVGSNGCNALQFGTETLGDFRDFLFENITITSAGKAGIGMVSMDGAIIHDITFKNISMSNIVHPIFMYIGARLRGPYAKPGVANDSLVGSISNIAIKDVVITRVGKNGRGKLPVGAPLRNHTITIEGQPVDAKYGLVRAHLIGPNITINGVAATVSGGGITKDVLKVPPHQTPSPWPRTLGVLPAYGLFVRRVVDLTLVNVTVSYDAGQSEGRPAFVLSDVSDVRFEQVTAERARPGLSYDVGLRGNCTNVSASGSAALVLQNIPGRGQGPEKTAMLL
jgi:polygalacturonase